MLAAGPSPWFNHTSCQCRSLEFKEPATYVIELLQLTKRLQVSLLAVSEFGRRLLENSSIATNAVI
ncbi:MAG: hypothetical protein EBV08_10450 [Synechococcaceae bacterium WB6_1B_055]|nr:hypothetical protein [Synechococcaceae bacterium WB6_1B_055]NBR43931.1 hypothetical protein [Synechococcaceae bacterium WB5_2B_268]NCU76370.1 hypothetical protein [Synechococcaceae bacterium WB7_1C_051]NCU91670.1 hypothetical protein [Synechococcaceae bacterium WB7_1B_046]NDD20871.1 hypothetical protein [Synechococcaceae bacterium WBA_3_309]NDE21918.1 hypothetical protein [Synechococcaceae bacterium WB9_3_282]